MSKQLYFSTTVGLLLSLLGLLLAKYQLTDFGLMFTGALILALSMASYLSSLTFWQAKPALVRVAKTSKR